MDRDAIKRKFIDACDAAASLSASFRHNRIASLSNQYCYERCRPDTELQRAANGGRQTTTLRVITSALLPATARSSLAEAVGECTPRAICQCLVTTLCRGILLFCWRCLTHVADTEWDAACNTTSDRSNAWSSRRPSSSRNVETTPRESPSWCNGRPSYFRLGLIFQNSHANKNNHGRLPFLSATFTFYHRRPNPRPNPPP